MILNAQCNIIPFLLLKWGIGAWLVMSLHHTDTQNKANRMHFSTRDPNDDDVRNPLTQSSYE